MSRPFATALLLVLMPAPSFLGATDALPSGAIGRQRADGGAVHAVALSADGRLLATASTQQDRETGKQRTLLRLGEATGGKSSLQWYAPEKRTHAVTFAPDGKLLVSGGSDWMVRLWDPATGNARGRLVGHADEIRALVFSPDGKVLASIAGRDRTVYLWDPTAARELRQLNGPAAVLAVAFSADGQTLAAAGEDGKVRLYHVATGRRLGQYELSAGNEPHGATLSPDGQTVALAGWNGQVGLRGLETGKLLHPLQSDELKAVRLAFSPDGGVLAACDRTAIRLWETASGQQLAEFRGHTGPLSDLAFSGDGRLLTSGSEDGAVLLWDLTFGASAASTPSDPARLGSELASVDAPQARRALWKLTTLPEKAVPLLREQLRPAGPAEPERVKKLIAELDDDSFAVREKASRELRALGARAERVLRQTMQDQPTPEVRRRVQELLDQLEHRPVSLPPDELGRLRAVQALEQIGSAEATKVLEALAGSDTSTRQAQAARAALARLKSRPRRGH